MSNTNTSTPPGADNTGALAPAPPQPPAVVTTAQQQQLQVPDAFNNANALAADRKKWGGLQPALYERVAIFPKQDADVNNTDSKLAYYRACNACAVGLYNEDPGYAELSWTSRCAKAREEEVLRRFAPNYKPTKPPRSARTAGASSNGPTTARKMVNTETSIRAERDRANIEKQKVEMLIFTQVGGPFPPFFLPFFFFFFSQQ